MTTEDELKAKIDDLELELEKKDKEIFSYLDKIEALEDQIMKLELLLPDDDSKKKGKKGLKDSKLAIELQEKEREIRALKDKMGFLRKEKTQLQQELERMAKQGTKGSVIRIEEKKTPFDELVKDLQSKINKQRLLITKLKQQSISADSAELNEELRKKEEEIKALKLDVSELNEKIKQMKESSITTAQDKASETIAKSLTEELQNQLNKSKRQIEALKKKLSAYEKKGKKGKVIVEDSAVDNLKDKIDELKEEINNKNKEIENLKQSIKSLEKAGETAISQPSGAKVSEPISALTEELQNKLNKAKIQIKTLQEQLKKYKSGKIPAEGPSESELEDELKMQKEMVISLQQKLEEQKGIIESKEGELGVVKNEANQIKIKYEGLESQIKLKEQKIAELKTQVEALRNQAQTPLEDPQIALRLRELKSLLDDLQKQNIQQRIEISQLRKI
ncbi:MAG: hypothetical protein ACTSQJ_06395 [Promethearchaeota archaeon]